MRITALAAALSIAAPLAAQQVNPEVFTLDNGMKFLLLPRTDQPNVIAAGWVAKVGSVNERPGITGLRHFLEPMKFKGPDTKGTPPPDAEPYSQRPSGEVPRCGIARRNPDETFQRSA